MTMSTKNNKKAKTKTEKQYSVFNKHHSSSKRVSLFSTYSRLGSIWVILNKSKPVLFNTTLATNVPNS